MSPGRVAKRGVASACHDEALNAKEEVSCATDEIKLWLVASVACVVGAGFFKKAARRRIFFFRAKTYRRLLRRLPSATRMLLNARTRSLGPDSAVTS